jgi:hypothetical protein
MTRRMYVYRRISEEAATDIENCQIERYVEWRRGRSGSPAPEHRPGPDDGPALPLWNRGPDATPERQVDLQ